MTVKRLVALDMPASLEFASHVRDAWNSGDAVFPIDQRLPQAAKHLLIQHFAPSAVIDATGNVTTLSNSEPIDEHDALVIATSGSTGSPKGVVHTHQSIRSLLDMSQTRLDTNTSTHWLLCLPVSHVAGFSILARSILFGNPITIFPTFETSNVIAAVKHGATHTSLVPTALQRIDPSIFHTILLGGAAAPAELPPNVTTTYGMTETFGGIAYNGRPLYGVNIRIDNDRIELRSPSLFRTYRGTNSQHSASDWYATGDNGQYQDGMLRVFGRLDDLIITGGENVWPSVVEKIVSTLPGIEQIVVRGVDDPEWGQRVVAWIVASRNIVPTLEEVRLHVKEQLPSFCAPSEVRIVEQIPMTSLGKVDAQALRKLS